MLRIVSFALAVTGLLQCVGGSGLGPTALRLIEASHHRDFGLHKPYAAARYHAHDSDPLFDVEDVLDAYNSRDVCWQPARYGSCYKSLVRFAFNPAIGACSVFLWSGCGGSDNRFTSQHECHARCGGVYLPHKYIPPFSFVSHVRPYLPHLRLNPWLDRYYFRLHGLSYHGVPGIHPHGPHFYPGLGHRHHSYGYGPHYGPAYRVRRRAAARFFYPKSAGVCGRPNELLAKCGRVCSCQDLAWAGECQLACSPGAPACFCIEGFVRNRYSGLCVPEGHCQNCGPNEVLAGAGSICQCSDLAHRAENAQPPGCAQAKTQFSQTCFCQAGFARDDLSGKCVPERQCGGYRR